MVIDDVTALDIDATLRSFHCAYKQFNAVSRVYLWHIYEPTYRY